MSIKQGSFWCDEPGCEASFRSNKWEKVRASDQGWFFSFRDETSWCPEHVPDWVPAWREGRKARSAAAYLEMEKRIKATGEPGEGTMLRAAVTTPEVACQDCGPLKAPPRGWSADWDAVSRQAMRHVLETGHQVAVSLWHGAIYGPERE